MELKKNKRQTSEFARTLTREQSLRISQFVTTAIKRKTKPFYTSKKLSLVSPTLRSSTSALSSEKPKEEKDQQSDLRKTAFEITEPPELLELLKKTHKRALSHVDSRRKLLSQKQKNQGKGIAWSKPLVLKQRPYFDFNRLDLSPRNIFYEGLQEMEQSKEYSKNRYNQEQKQKTAKRNYNQIDAIDLQFREGLVEDLYSNKKVKLRKQMNDWQWKRRIQRRSAAEELLHSHRYC